MKSSIRVFLLLFVGRLAAGQDVDLLSELPFAELLARKKIVEGGRPAEGLPAASAMVAPPPDLHFKGIHDRPNRKTFLDDDYEDEKGHLQNKKGEHKIHDILNTSIMALSYLAFGGYLLCMIANALRDKRRRIAMTYPTAAPSYNNHFVLQHNRPSRPFIRFPAVTVHHGGKKRRRRRSTRKEAPRGEEDSSQVFNIIDYIQHVAHGGD